MRTEGLKSRWLLWSAFLFGVVLLPGCSGRILPPPSPETPQQVFVLDHGRHSSLLLPHENGLARYSWGDLEYYGFGNTDLSGGLHALFVPSASILARQSLPDANSLDEARAWLSVPVRQAITLEVEAEDIKRLRQRLDAHFATADTVLHNAAYGFDFVAYPRRYSFFDNSNRRVGDWLSELGCEIHGPQYFSSWKLLAAREAEADPL